MNFNPEIAPRPQRRIPTSLASAFALVGLLSLTACGGGGGSSDTGTTTPVPAPAPAPAPGPVPAPSPAPTAGPINTTAQTSTYVAGSPEASAFTTLNSERGACGFGFLKQAAKLDLAASDANGYFVDRAAEGLASAQAFSHLEDASKSGFTGQFASDRASYRGYTFDTILDVNEDNATRYSLPASPLSNAALSDAMLSNLLTSVYHVSSLMTDRTEVGLAFVRSTTSDSYDAGRLNIVVGRPPGDAAQDATVVRTYPCAGTTYVAASFVPSTEGPNPAPDLGTTTVGTPIYVNGPASQTLTVESATVVETGNGLPVGNRVITYTNDPVYVSQNVHALAINEAFILPLSPLTTGSSYTVTITGNSNGTAFTTTFAFTPSK